MIVYCVDMILCTVWIRYCVQRRYDIVYSVDTILCTVWIRWLCTVWIRFCLQIWQTLHPCACRVAKAEREMQQYRKEAETLRGVNTDLQKKLQVSELYCVALLQSCITYKLCPHCAVMLQSCMTFKLCPYQGYSVWGSVKSSSNSSSCKLSRILTNPKNAVRGY